jgi:hypothetical protein
MTGGTNLGSVARRNHARYAGSPSWPRCIGVFLTLTCSVAAGATQSVGAIESTFADFNDAQGAVSLIDSDPQRYTQFERKSRAEWQQLYVAQRADLSAALGKHQAGLSREDQRAITVMRAAVRESSATPDSLAPTGHCTDARRTRQPLRTLQQSLYACFSELANNLQFEGATVTRVAAFELLTRMPEPERRKALFLAFVPLWQAVNGADQPDSPYRRMIGQASAEARTGGSPVDEAARTIEVPVAEVERWLQVVLEAWRLANPDTPQEPWDYRFAAGAAERELAAAVPRKDLQSLNQRFYVDLGLDLAQARVLYDLEPRPGKAPLAYTDYIRRGRQLASGWQPTLVRVSANYEHGGLGPLNEFVHENGHAAHMLALHTRPAFMDLGDALFYEAFADVPAWSVYEPRWQDKYLGKHASESASLRARYAAVMLDVAWALFECRMLREPAADPNAVWTAITSRYLHITPHPELAWWAVRVQLVDKPGYMVNYGLGAIITADLRQRITSQLGPFDSGEPRWFGWLADNLLKSGEAQPTAVQLRQFLGRGVTPQALLDDLRRIAPAAE